jgi:3-oxoacyl-[acyl-carrier-protein] synthase II
MDWDLLLSSSSTLSGTVAAKLGIMGHVCTINTACSSGTTSLGFACDLLHSGECDSVLAGGADLVSEVTFAGFNCLQSLTQDRCRPLDGNRSGLMLGEGAAIFCLERRENAIARKAEVLGWILGYSAINEAYHETAPNPTGEGATEAMLLAMKDSGIGVDCIDYVNVHGTATPANDAMEMISLRRVFGDRLESIKVSSTKSQIGHSLGAAGSLELAATLLCMGVGHVPPTLHHQTPMEGYENIDIVLGKAKPWPVRAAISNSFAFAGHLSSIVVHHKNLEIG